MRMSWLGQGRREGSWVYIYSEQGGEWQEIMWLESKHEDVTEDLLGRVKDLEFYRRTVENH